VLDPSHLHALSPDLMRIRGGKPERKFGSDADNLWIAFLRNEVRSYGPALSPESRPKVRTSQTTGDAQEASAFAFSWSNSAWVIAPLSSRLFADAIWSAGLLP
jgi:hypothetical protein